VSTTSVLFVCHANVCRSPLAEATFRHAVRTAGREQEFHIDSAGTFAMEGAPPHPHSVEVGHRHGIEVAGRSRQLLRADLERFDHVLVMDRANLDELEQLAAPAAFGPISSYRAHIELLRVAAGTGAGRDVNVGDPIGQDVDAYESTYALLEAAMRALLVRLS
jgi:protein-tyrosine phosphatase